MNDSVILVRGGGDLASGVVHRLFRCGIKVVVAELPNPLAVRRSVSFANTVYTGKHQVEDISAVLVRSAVEIEKTIKAGLVPVIVDPEMEIVRDLDPKIVVDARMIKFAQARYATSIFSIGLGPGFIAGETCNAVIETKRGHHLGRVYWQGGAEPDSGVPERVGGHESERVLRSPAQGKIKNYREIGDLVRKGDIVAEVSGKPVISEFDGVIRGLVYEGIDVTAGLKIGDIDPRNDPALCHQVSDKALAIGGGVLEALLTRKNIRKLLWT
ncbi:MAG: EF2563 family selenium-dependent molybdenum hydroxylase system protein [Anaerolineae bacterium]|nr:EF2563 family selenium-dependent molybdenum hydroxylase system protein [Anaerolineae bacterium]